MTSIEWQVWNSPTPKHVDVPIKTVNHSLRCGGFFEGMNGRRFFRGHHNMPLCGFVSVIIHQHHSVDGLNIHTSSKNITCKEQTSKILTKLLQDPVPQLGRRMNPFTCAFASLFPPTYIPIITLNPAFFKLQLDVLWRFPVLECSKKHISYACGQIRPGCWPCSPGSAILSRRQHGRSGRSGRSRRSVARKSCVTLQRKQVAFCVMNSGRATILINHNIF